MKKALLSLTFLVAVLFSSQNSYAFKIFGIEIKYERGIKEWNANHTATECVGRGMCSLTVGGSVGLAAQIGNVDGTLVIAVPGPVYAQHPEDFDNNRFDVNFDFQITPAQAAELNYSGPMAFHAGTYDVQYDQERDEYQVLMR